MVDYKSAFEALAADMGAIAVLLGHEDGFPGIDQLLRNISDLRTDHFRGVTKMIIDKVVAETNIRNHSDWHDYVRDIIETADRCRMPHNDQAVRRERSAA